MSSPSFKISWIFHCNEMQFIECGLFWKMEKSRKAFHLHRTHKIVDIFLAEMLLIMMHDWLWRKYWRVLCIYSLADPGGARNVPPLGPNSFMLLNNRFLSQTLGLTPSSWKSWIHHCYTKNPVAVSWRVFLLFVKRRIQRSLIMLWVQNNCISSSSLKWVWWG